jgi:hypothetical protein
MNLVKKVAFRINNTVMRLSQKSQKVSKNFREIIIKTLYISLIFHIPVDIIVF